jgi:hypothetical protein
VNSIVGHVRYMRRLTVKICLIFEAPCTRYEMGNDIVKKNIHGRVMLYDHITLSTRVYFCFSLYNKNKNCTDTKVIECYKG